ncbi:MULTISPECIES: hypothetical protein [Enterococcus]|uniref:hypothetical protein n=1 Tax=Enterococcus TaxID=1350 RepID=UPI000A32B6B7|nr:MULTISPECIES: hypothetical protein [Enterococcus]MBO0423365.1 hypothetical protein [Enterococcus plantarum]OTN83893.1 hypothetical protein A5819_003712 [Enterococcus sp. 7E2_DIV0204]OTP47544.1 hypothetical protein A5884_003515 [Enterococcus sp. 7D2_DIV0200]
MARKKRAAGDFSSAFDEELDNVETPEDDLQNETLLNPTNNLTNTVVETIPTDEERTSDTTSTSDNSNKFGLIRQNQQNVSEMIPRTYKLRQDTVDGLESLVYRDKKRNKKIPGTKGFISDFVDNAIWQHFLQLGLITEEEANKHVKDYSKYPINIENFTDFMNGIEEDLY